jgi:hypothetical protein
MKGLKIGLTLGLQSTSESMWTNGIKLNTFILFNLLKNSEQEYDVCLLNTFDIDLENKPAYLKDIPTYFFDLKYEEMDVIICIGSQIFEHHLKHFKSLPNKKVVSYKCGNDYVISMEDVLFKASPENTHHYEKDYDEVWYIPQQHETNGGFYHTLYRTRALTVPFVWDSKYIFDSLVDIEKGYQAGNFKKTYAYDSTKKVKRVGVMEPNINIVKYCMIPAMIAEESYRGPIGKEKIEKLMITNSENVSKHKKFMSVIQTFDLFKDNKITAENRYQTAYILSQYIDVLICHQLLNPLNYIYLDAAYMGYPVLHNAPMCKDLGYYYNGSDTIDGAKQLDWILENHDNNLEEYAERNAKVLSRYSASNPYLIKTYDKLLENLFNGGNHDLEYEPETNLYKNLSIED